MKKDAISITDKAISHLKTLLSQNTNTDVVGIRIGIKSGGCSGFTYFLEYAINSNKYDEIIKQNGITLLIDPKALMYLIGTKMDYEETEFKSGFVFVNPNEKGKCGCGKSFSI